MGHEYGRLGAVRPDAGDTEYELYQVPAGTSAVVNLSICNVADYSISIRVARTTDSHSAYTWDWLLYDTEVSANDGYQPFTGLSMGPSETLRVSCNVADVCVFIADGLEIS